MWQKVRAAKGPPPSPRPTFSALSRIMRCLSCSVGMFRYGSSTSVHCQPSSMTTQRGGVPPLDKLCTASDRPEADTAE